MGLAASTMKALGEIASWTVDIINSFDNFPMNIVCLAVVLVLWNIRIYFAIPFLGHALAACVYFPAYLLRLSAILARYLYFYVATTLVSWMDSTRVDDGELKTSEWSLQMRRVLLQATSCRSDPRTWFATGQAHLGNSRARGLGMQCFAPCSSRHAPALAGTVCRKVPSSQPRYCARAMVARAYAGLGTDGKKSFDSNVPQGFFEACEEARAAEPVLPSDDLSDKTIDRLLRGVCQQHTVAVADPAAVSGACHAAFCSGGRDDVFCHRLAPGAAEPVSVGAVVERMLLLGALAAATTVGLRFLMRRTQERMVAAEREALDGVELTYDDAGRVRV